MTVTCPQCGTPNETPAGAVGVTCRTCGGALSGEALLARLPLNKTRRTVDSTRPAPISDAPGAAGPMGHSTSQLGAMPDAGQEDAFDLSAILDPVPAPSAQPNPSRGPRSAKPAFVPAFTFPGNEDRNEPGPEDPLAAVGLLDDALPPPPGQATRVVSPGQSPVWRVRNERGIEYELMTVDAVVAWLEGKSSYDQVRVARGSGPFEQVEDVPELAARLGIRAAQGSAGFAGGQDAAPLRLGIEAAPPRRPAGSRAPQPVQARANAGAASRGNAFAPAASVGTAARIKVDEGRGDLERAWGMGFVLALAGASCALAGALALLAAQQDLVPSVPTVEVRGESADPPPAPLLASALEAFEARRYTAAEQLLLQAAKNEPPDPRVQRLLALSLSKLGGRDREARDALARYRSLRAGGVEN